MPPPLPAVAVMVYVLILKVAVTFCAEFIVTVHVPVPEHAPDQPVNVELASAVAVSVTEAPEAYDAEQVEPQLIPAGEDATEPVPVPVLFTVREYC